VSCVQITRRRYGTICGSLLCPLHSQIDFPFPPLQRVSSKAQSGTSRLFRLSCKVLLHNTASRSLISRHADNETDQPFGQGATINLTDNWVADLSHRFVWGALLSQFAQPGSGPALTVLTALWRRQDPSHYKFVQPLTRGPKQGQGSRKCEHCIFITCASQSFPQAFVS
jgi:hypothetical protein